MANDLGAVVLSVLPSIVTALSGLLGVFVGGAITWVKESRKEKINSRKELLYLAILISSHLDKFIDECIAVSFDDGTTEGHPAGQDGFTYEPVVEIPKFEPLSLDLEWRVLSPPLMQEILHLPRRIEKLRRKLDFIAEFDYPPDYTEYFFARQYDFTNLALDVLRSLKKLRKHAVLKDETLAAGERDRESELCERLENLEKKHEAYKKSQAKMVNDLNAL